MTHELSLKQTQKEYHGNLKSYLTGFVLSIVLTGISFSLVVFKALDGQSLVYTILSLALAQAIIQLIFFLHVGKEPKPYWETIVFAFMVMVLVIIAAGTLWIMYDLDNRVMANMTMEKPHD